MSEPYTGPIIDAHHHVWDFSVYTPEWLKPGVRVPHRYGDYEPIKHSYLPEDYLRDIARSGVVASVYVEAEWKPGLAVAEVEAVQAHQRTWGVPGAIVAQAWMDAPDIGEQLAALANCGLVRGVRHKPGGPRSPEEVASGGASLLGDERWRAGYAQLSHYGLSFDLQTPWWNLPEALRLAEDFPETTLIIDHAAVLLARDPETLKAWRGALEEVAQAPNVVIKASGLCVEGSPWSAELNREPVREMVRIFGAERKNFWATPGGSGSLWQRQFPRCSWA